MQEKASAESPPTPEEDLKAAAQEADLAGLESVRRRGLFLMGAVFWAGLLAFLLLVGSSSVVLLNQGLDVLADLRGALGLHAPVAGPDWLLLGVLFAATALALLVMWGLWRFYRRSWDRRLAEVWPERADRRRWGRLKRLPAVASEEDRRERLSRLQALLTSSAWRADWDEVRQASDGELPADTAPDDLGAASYEPAAQAALAHLEKEVAERAITTGLIVGVSPNRIVDSLTIVLAAFEIQMHVLTRLGLKPSLRLWPQLLKRSGASLFANSYLNRQDALAISFAIKKTAMGLQAASEMVEEGRDLLSELDADEALDHLLGDGVLPSRLRPVVSASVLGAGLGLGVGSVGLRLVGAAVEKIGDDLLQGVLAGGVLYFHGMALASECLALDQRHRATAPMSRSFLDCVRAVGAAAGAILREQIRARKEVFRQRRTAAVKQSRKIAGSAFKRFWS